MPIAGKYIFKTYYLSSLKLTNNTTNKVTIQTDTGSEFTIASGKSKTYSLSSLAEGEKFMVFVTVYDAKTSKDNVYVITCFHSKFSGANIQINASALNSLNEENVVFAKDADHRNDHIRKFTLKNPTGDSGYAIKLKVNYTMPNGSTGNYTTGSYAISNSKTVDLVSGVKLPDGTKVQLVAIGCASGKSDAKAKQTYYVYKDSTREAKYNFKGHWTGSLSVSLQSYK